MVKMIPVGSHPVAAMSSPLVKSSPCSCCPNTDSVLHTHQEAGCSLLASVEEDDGHVADGHAETSVEETLLRHLSDFRSRQEANLTRATLAKEWDSFSTKVPSEAADEATPVQAEWSRLQAMAQGASELSPIHRPTKRARQEFEDVPATIQGPQASPHPMTCIEALQAELARVLKAHIGTGLEVDLSCAFGGHSLVDKKEGYRMQISFHC